MAKNRHYESKYISYSGANNLKVSADTTSDLSDINLSLNSTASLLNSDDEQVRFYNDTNMVITYEQAKQIIKALSELVDSHEEAKALAQFDSARDDSEEVKI